MKALSAYGRLDWSIHRPIPTLSQTEQSACEGIVPVTGTQSSLRWWTALDREWGHHTSVVFPLTHDSRLLVDCAMSMSGAHTCFLIHVHDVGHTGADHTGLVHVSNPPARYGTWFTALNDDSSCPLRARTPILPLSSSKTDGAANLLASLDPQDAWLDLTDAWIRTYLINDPDHQPGSAPAAATATAVHAQARIAHPADYPTHPQRGLLRPSNSGTRWVLAQCC